jgi:hypothetical protein
MSAFTIVPSPLPALGEKKEARDVVLVDIHELVF